MGLGPLRYVSARETSALISAGCDPLGEKGCGKITSNGLREEKAREREREREERHSVMRSSESSFESPRASADVGGRPTKSGESLRLATASRRMTER